MPFDHSLSPEDAVFYRRLLAVGITAPYLQHIERLLEAENPLTDPLLELSFCLSDTDRTLHVLDEYIGVFQPDESTLYLRILNGFRQLLRENTLTPQRAAAALVGILHNNELSNDAVWRELTELIWDLEDAWFDGIPSFADFSAKLHELSDEKILSLFEGILF